MLKRIIAFLTTAVLTLSAAAIPNVQAADKTVTDPIIGELPDWIPRDFADAMEFYNTHGKSYVDDNVICLVRPMIQHRIYDYTYSIAGSMTTVNTPAEGKKKIYELDIPKKPDPTDEQAVRAYEEYCDKLGLYSHDYSFFESYEGCKTQYAFEVELFRVIKNYDLTVIWSERNDGDFKVTETFHFSNDDDWTYEDDYYCWLPDCPTEYRGYSADHSRASVFNNYIAYWSDVNYSTGASLKTEQSGDGKIELVTESDCNGFQLVPLDGSANNSVFLYKPIADGKVDVKWTVGREWSDEEPYLVTEGNYEIKDNCKTVEDNTPDKGGRTIITFIDKDTGEPIDIPGDKNDFRLTKASYSDKTPIDTYDISSNPLTINSADAYSFRNKYYISMESEGGRYIAPEFVVTFDGDYCAEVDCKLKWKPNCDANGDGSFGTADYVHLKKWLLGVSDITFKDWNAADLCRDGKLNAIDLNLMKKELLKETVTECVEPIDRFDYGTPFTVCADELTMYLGPDERYRAVAVIPKDTKLRERGYAQYNDHWVFTEYNGQYGWLRTEDEDSGEYNVWFEQAAAKPVIYLYPEKETDVHVELELTESELSTTYPKYNDGWDVTAYPDGSLVNKADGSHHRYLFWDSKNCRTRYAYSKGFCVAGEDTESFLKEKLTYMGLTEEEMNEFIVYWLPRMEHNKYNLITFQGDTYTDTAKLSITPKPDSVLRIFMAYVPLDKAVSIEPQQLDTFERKGFTVVEWGGNEIS